jgi:hypothetical protein
MVELSQGRNVQHAYTWLLMKPGMDRAKVGCVTDLILPMGRIWNECFNLSPCFVSQQN